jgi:hypothetical protein
MEDSIRAGCVLVQKEPNTGWLSRHWQRILVGLAAVLVAYWILRGCVPSLGGGLPSRLAQNMRDRYTVCISDTAVWPGEPRQPECGQVEIKVVGQGTVPPSAASNGVERALCFQLRYTNPYWTTQGTTRHEIIEHGRLVSKVALYRGGDWVVGPDQDQADEARWTQYVCPGEFRSEAFNP